MTFHRTVAVVVVCLAAVPWCPAEEFAVLVKMGLKDKDAVSWSGSVSATGGEITALDGWRFERGAKVTGEWSWECKSRDPGGPKGDKRRKIQPVGVVVGGQGDSGTELTLTVPAGTFTVNLAQLPNGKRVQGLDGTVSAERVPRPNVLSGSDREDDYPSLCVAPNDVLWCVWQSYENEAEQLYVASCDADGWEAPVPVPGAKGDLYKSGCAWVGGRLRVVWSQFTDGDWDLHAASRGGGTWSETISLTAAPGADVEPVLAAAGNMALLVWQSTRGSHSDIRCRVLRDGTWGDTMVVTEAEGNDWFPQVALGGDGTASIVWDSYRNGDYDVYLRQLKDGAFGPEIPVGASELFEAYATVAVDMEGRAWVAYEEGTAGWGKDQGAMVPRPAPGSRLYSKRATRVRVFQGGQLFTPEAQPVTITPPGQPRRYHEKPRLTVDGKGRVFLALRWAMATTRYLRGKGHYRHYKAWESYITSYDGNVWTSPVYFPRSISRLDSYAIPCGLREGGVALAWHTDSRTMADVRLPVKNRVLAARLPSPGDPAPPVLKPIAIPVPAAPEAAPKEMADTQRIRTHRADLDGKEQRIVRGDTH
ncbi:MAG: hypothetical protein HON70_02495, partial [Lentisphaerae bacterium]|nr:hypothetical protein [Lentisphaerota bacterium]